MFSKQLRTIFTVLGNALLALAAMPAEGDGHEEMTGAQYIAKLDTPDAGKELPNATTGTAALVFAGQSTQDASAVFGSHGSAALGADAAKLEAMAGPGAAGPTLGQVLGLPTYTMTAKAEGFAREQFHETGWTDEALVERGIMVVDTPVAQDTRPNVQPVSASGTLPAPSAPPIASTPAAAPAGPAHTDAQAHVGAVMRDSSGLPWDARIHSGGRTTKTDGTWQKKKGVSDVEVARVTAELRSAAPAQVAAPFTPLNAAAPAPAAPAAAAPPAAAATPAPAPAPPAPATGATNAITEFAPFCKWCTASGYSMGEALEFAKPYGITAMGLLAQPSNAAFIPLIHADMAAKRAA